MQNMKKSTVSIILGVGLLLGGSFFIPFSTVWQMMNNRPPSVAFKIPGGTTFQANQAGRYYLWNNYRTLFNGTSYNLGQALPNGIHIEITDSTTGSKLNLIGSASISVTSGSSSKTSIGYVDINQPCLLQLQVSGHTEPRIFSFGRSRFGELIKSIILTALLTILSIIGGITLIIVGIVMASKKRQPAPIRAGEPCP
jgi:hypothetical protein